MLEIEDLHVFYGSSHVLRGIGFSLPPGQMMALLGRNGAGRSTAAKAIMGLLPWQGRMAWKGQSLEGKTPFEIARLGIGYVPESRDVFPTLTVRQNLLLGQKKGGGLASANSRWSFDDTYRLFPQLKEREHVPAGVLSGGEQQLLSLCRSLMGEPELLVMDEPTEGLAPQMVERVAACLALLRERGVALLLVEQRLSVGVLVPDNVLVMGRGEIVFQGTPDALDMDHRLRGEWLDI